MYGFNVYNISFCSHVSANYINFFSPHSPTTLIALPELTTQCNVLIFNIARQLHVYDKYNQYSYVFELIFTKVLTCKMSTISIDKNSKTFLVPYLDYNSLICLFIQGYFRICVKLFNLLSNGLYYSRHK